MSLLRFKKKATKNCSLMDLSISYGSSQTLALYKKLCCRSNIYLTYIYINDTPPLYLGHVFAQSLPNLVTMFTVIITKSCSITSKIVPETKSCGPLNLKIKCIIKLFRLNAVNTQLGQNASFVPRQMIWETY